MTATTRPHSSRTRPTRPGWPEIAVAAVVYLALYFLILGTRSSWGQSAEVVRGLALAAASGLMGLAAFTAAFLIRIRVASVFGLRRIRPRMILASIGFGLVAVLVGRVLAVVATVTHVPLTDPQGSYHAAAAGGVLAFVLQLLFIAVLTPIGEEFAFRGVLANGLRRLGPVVGVAVSALVFALAHGVNLALIPAIAVGVINGILFYRTRSVWPGVIVHSVNNVVGTVLPLLFTAG